MPKTSLTKMFKHKETFIIVALFLIICCDRTSSECTRLTACSCVFPDGYGYDLRNLTNFGLLNATAYDFTIHFQPCKNVPMALVPNVTQENQCYQGKGVSLCVNNTLTNFTSLGTMEEGRLVLPSEINKNPALVFHHKQFQSTIDLLCCDKCTTNFRIDSPPVKNQYHLILTSPSACKVLLHPRGLSTGSILVILFFVFAGIYFGGGALVLKVTRGATGWEMLPNHDFWCSLPSLVRDGISFTFNCFHADAYERI